MTDETNADIAVKASEVDGVCVECHVNLYGQDDQGCLCMTCGEPYPRMPEGGVLIWSSDTDQNNKDYKPYEKTTLSKSGKVSPRRLTLKEQADRKRGKRTTTVPIDKVMKLKGVNSDPAEAGPRRGTTSTRGKGLPNSKGPPRSTPKLTDEQEESQIVQGLNLRQRRIRERQKKKQEANAKRAAARDALKSNSPQKNGGGVSKLGF